MMLDLLNLSRQRKLPIIVGGERAECGLACLTMIANYFEHDVDLNFVRQKFPISLTGTTLRTVLRGADSFNLGPRAVRVEMEDLDQLQLPAILHWDLNHFVVLKAIKKTHYVLHDPAIGHITRSRTEMDERFSGVAVEFHPSEPFEKIKNRSITRIRDLWTHINGLKRSVVQVLLLSFIMQVAILVAPFYLQLTVDEVIQTRDIELLYVLALGFTGLLIIQVISTAIRNWVINALGFMISFQVIANLARHMLRLKTDFFERRHVGDIMSRLSSVLPIRDALTKGLATALIDGIMILIATVILFLYSPLLALIVLCSLILTAIFTFILYPAQYLRTEENIVAQAEAHSILMENVRAATTIKIMGRDTERHEYWLGHWARSSNSAFSVEKYTIGMKAGQAIITGIQLILVVFIAAKMNLEGHGFSIGMLFAFLSYRQTMTESTLTLIDQVLKFRYISLHLDRVGDIVHSEPEAEREESGQIFSGDGGIDVQNITFQYSPSDPVILENASMTIEAGSFVAITGPSGGGKTTLLKILLGLYSPQQGKIFLDGLPTTPGLFQSWRDQIGVVAQDDTLLSGTIADNIAFSDMNMDMVKVYDAAKMAGVHDEIMRLPMQYLSLVGDMGSMLSGGQTQRVLLARALYREPKILILDEGTANLDPDTEMLIVDLLSEMPITRIVVAHRPALIKRAERVFKVEDQKISQIR